MEQERYLSLGVDYLGLLNAELRDLRGFRTLANELIQNANDAAGATTIRFDARADALLVENDGVFSDCDEVEKPGCPWQSQKGHLCDFHRFRNTASGDKRREAHTTGAFGVGFISVYQITDRPELWSGTRRWIVCPEEDENHRIRVDPAAGRREGTQFRLPWAFQESDRRRRLGVEPVPTYVRDRFIEELLDHLRVAILFLNRVRAIELYREGEEIVSVQRRAGTDDAILLVQRGQQDWQWKVLRGSFPAESADLRDRHVSQIERKRTDEVAVAIPLDDVDAIGRLYATLPTESQFGIPIAVQADFFPSSDRKRVLFDEDYQGKWNQAAVGAAARAMADDLSEIHDRLGAVSLWRLVDSARDVKRRAEKGEVEPVLGLFWDHMEPMLRSGKFVRTSEEQWCGPGDTLLFQSVRDELPALPVLVELGLRVVHPQLSAHANTLREIGVPVLTAIDLARAIKANGLTRSIRIEEAPSWLRKAEVYRGLGEEVERLLHRLPPERRAGATSEFLDCTLAFTIDGSVAPPRLVRRADAETIALFSGSPHAPLFLAEENHPAITELVPRFSVEDGIRELEGIDAQSLTARWRQEPDWPQKVVLWFQDHRAEFVRQPSLAKRLRNARIWPAGQGLHSLGDLSVPGDFVDPLDLAGLVDARIVERAMPFLTEELGASRLTVKSYAKQHVPIALQSEKALSSEARHRLLTLLAENVGKLEQDPEIRDALTRCPIVPCDDGGFRCPPEAYFDSELVRTVLGETAPRASLPDQLGHGAVELLRWLGVADVPRGADIVARVRAIATGGFTASSRGVIREVFAALGRNFDKVSDSELGPLRDLAWLPARSADCWLKPAEVYAAYSSHLFETQGRFLDIERPIQDRSRDFIEFLGIGVEPTVGQVVDHLLECARRGSGVNREVYRRLDQRSDDLSLAKLRDQACLRLPDGRYVAAGSVFWGEQPFGRFRAQLGSDWREFTKLLQRLNVREHPDASDAVAVLREIGAQFGATNSPLDEEAHGVVIRCWRLLSDAISTDGVGDVTFTNLKSVTVIPDLRNVLVRADRMFFEDRPRLAEKFGEFLRFHVIPRPDGAWRAMLGAGVRHLSEVVEVDVVECDPVVDDEHLTSMVQSRWELIRRVLPEGRVGGIDPADLSQAVVAKASRLTKVYKFHEFGQSEHSAAEEAVVHFATEENRIYIVCQPHTPWAAMARELALAINPLGEAGPLAAAIKEVLSADSDEAATAVLDDLGFAPPTQVIDAVVPDHGEVGIGAEDDTLLLDGKREVDRDEEVSRSSDDEGGTRRGDEENRRDQKTGGDGGRQRGSSTPTGSQLILRSYVRAGNAGPSSGVAVGAQPSPEVDRAGVNAVLAYEGSQGRSPTEMPHNHPGYDIESRDSEDGEVTRFIEVKSLAGTWRALGAGISSTQYEQARVLGERFWLYVVENAASAIPVIHRFRDPCGKITEYRFDDGWREFADEAGGVKRRSILDLRADKVDGDEEE